MYALGIARFKLLERSMQIKFSTKSSLTIEGWLDRSTNKQRWRFPAFPYHLDKMLQ